MTTQLEGQIKVVAEARGRIAQLREEKNLALSMWENENKELLRHLDTTAEAVNVAEAWLRTLTLQAYNETGNKAPAVGVGIREVTKLTYGPREALTWATDHRMALKLDVSAFEKIVKVSPLDFVTITQEPQATIATNLLME